MTFHSQETPFPSASFAKVDTETPLHELFGQMEWSEWPDANLQGALVYVRGITKLDIPAEFRPYLPLLSTEGI